ncbi:UBX domain-containing protein 7 isoform X1 [Vespula squamosa]|uniref:UBX domain-containing protein 7 isoform X1 n=1 Tax=Vespula squamosa TaxID=30214 RepID=A0ABD2B8L8_VESSQ
MDRELVEKFMEITGKSEATACQYLSLADGNVEMAVTLMFEEGQVPQVQAVDSEPEVRPPILPTQEILVDSEPMFSLPRLPNAFDRFRDFALETQRQEEEMTLRVAGVKESSQPKSKRLEDLFRPPSNILFLGTFVDAREHAKSLNRWLLVNVQDSQEFVCQVLNRDVWSNEQIQEIVKDHFVLWQVLSNTKDGKNYIDFYKVINYPYLAVIDPRTGECIRKYNHITIDSLISDLNDILSIHASPEGASNDITNHKSDNFSKLLVKDQLSETSKNDHASCSKNTRNVASDRDSDSTCKQLDSQNNSNSNISSNSPCILKKRRRLDNTNQKVESPERVKQEEERVDKMQDSKTDINTDNDKPLLRLCLRLPTGDKETISMCATNTIEDFLKRMKDMGYPLADYTYLVPFPKTNIGVLAVNIRLIDTILFPSNTVFITKT